MQLNEMQQIGLIRGYGFELVEQKGPPHQPVFVMRGVLHTMSGETVHTDAVEARSKKEGESAVAVPLLARAIEMSRS